MTAYIIVEIDTKDEELMAEYRKHTPGLVSKFGGKFIVRGGNCTSLEGGWTPGRLVVLEFPDLAVARTFYASAEYAEARAKRAGATRRFNMVVVQGV